MCSAATTARAASATKKIISAVWSQCVCSRVKSNESRATGPNSPTAPAAITYLPNRVFSSPESRSIGSKAPIPVVVVATPTSSGVRITPIKYRASARQNAIATDNNQPHTASVSGRPRNAAKFNSIPARKNRKIRPRIPSTLRTPSGDAHASMCGPITIPKATSTTIIGSRKPIGNSATNGESTAMMAASKSAGPLNCKYHLERPFILCSRGLDSKARIERSAISANRN